MSSEEEVRSARFEVDDEHWEEEDLLLRQSREMRGHLR